jgi:hypothetical protein
MKRKLSLARVVGSFKLLQQAFLFQWLILHPLLLLLLIYSKVLDFLTTFSFRLSIFFVPYCAQLHCSNIFLYFCAYKVFDLRSPFVWTYFETWYMFGFSILYFYSKLYILNTPIINLLVVFGIMR